MILDNRARDRNRTSDRGNRVTMSAAKSTRKVTIINPQGIHARPANMIVKCCAQFASDVAIVKGSERINGKSILEILTLAATEGTELSLEADGPDAEEALAALAELIAQGFGEMETMN
jgi:phosphotransferase system HPr (HPr) family protein